jgi:N4-gp56 family major capsid protein
MAAKSYNVGYGPNPTQVQYIASKDILETAPSITVIDIAFYKKTMNRQSGASIVYRRWLASAVDTTPAPEGSVKESRTLQWEDFNGTMLRYTERYQVTRVDYDLSPFDAVKGATERLKQLIVATRERVRWLAAVGGTNVFYNATAITSRPAVNGPITPGRVQTILRSLTNLKAEYFQKEIQGSDKEGTSPIEAAYYAFGHSDIEGDLRSFPGFSLVVNYGSGRGAHMQEFGAYQKARFFTSPDALKFSGAGAASTTMLNTSGNTDVYPVVFCGKNALCSVSLSGSGQGGYGNLKIDILDKADKSDPNNSWVDICADWYDLAMITSNDWLVRGEFGATANL